MGKNKTVIAPQGIRLDVDNQNTVKGGCLSLVGLRPEGGAWRPIPAKKIIVQALGSEKWVRTWVHPVFTVPEGKTYPEFVIGWARDEEAGVAPLCLLKVVELEGGNHHLEIVQTIATYDPDGGSEPDVYFQDNFMIVQYGNIQHTEAAPGDPEPIVNYRIQVSVNPTGYGTTTGQGTYNEGQEVTLVATPAAGNHFVNWTEDDVEIETETTLSFEVTENRTLVANFEAIPVEFPEGTVKLGYLYNYPALVDERGITSSDSWEVAKDTQYEEIRTLYTEVLAGGKLKETGTTNWTTPNTGADNSLNFNGRGTGIRAADGTFELIGEWCPLLTTTPEEGEIKVYELMHDAENMAMSNVSVNDGCPVRLFRDATTEELSLPNGSFAGTYTGNDLKEYNTVKIGSYVYLAENLAETLYRNGNVIPEVTDDEAWSMLTTGALCAYNNDSTNVMEE